MVNLYKCSHKKEHDEEYQMANNILEIVMFCFKVISVFTKTDHAKIVKQLYFDKDNIIVVGIKKMENIIFVPERTLLLYRKKYCDVIESIFVLIEQFAVK